MGCFLPIVVRVSELCCSSLLPSPVACFPCSAVMAPKRSQQSRRRDASPSAMSDPELEVDASWVDMDELPAPPDHFHKYSPPKCFYDQMVKDRDFWASGLSTLVDGDRIVRTIARAIHVTCVPWHTDWAQWRRHAADFFRRLFPTQVLLPSASDRSP